MITGILLAFFAGAFIALSMVTQRYALAYETYKVPMLCLSLPRPVVWFLGLIIYGIANGLYAVATATAIPSQPGALPVAQARVVPMNNMPVAQAVAIPGGMMPAEQATVVSQPGC